MTLVHIGTHAARTPEKPAAILSATGATMTYAELDARSRALASVLAGRGLGVGGRLAILPPGRGSPRTTRPARRCQPRQRR
jgi:long-chain acyl-CoA synthetase